MKHLEYIFKERALKEKIITRFESMHYGEVEKRRAESCHLRQISKVYPYFYPAHGIFVTVVGEAAVRQELTLQRVRCQICIIVWHTGRILKVLKN